MKLTALHNTTPYKPGQSMSLLFLGFFIDVKLYRVVDNPQEYTYFLLHLKVNQMKCQKMFIPMIFFMISFLIGLVIYHKD